MFYKNSVTVVKSELRWKDSISNTRKPVGGQYLFEKRPVGGSRISLVDLTLVLSFYDMVQHPTWFGTGHKLWNKCELQVKKNAISRIRHKFSYFNCATVVFYFYFIYLFYLVRWPTSYIQHSAQDCIANWRGQFRIFPV